MLKSQRRAVAGETSFKSGVLSGVSCLAACGAAASARSKHSVFCNHGALELRDLVTEAQAGCSLIVVSH